MIRIKDGENRDRVIFSVKLCYRKILPRRIIKLPLDRLKQRTTNPTQQHSLPILKQVKDDPMNKLRKSVNISRHRTYGMCVSWGSFSTKKNKTRLSRRCQKHTPISIRKYTQKTKVCPSKPAQNCQVKNPFLFTCGVAEQVHTMLRDVVVVSTTS